MPVMPRRAKRRVSAPVFLTYSEFTEPKPASKSKKSKKVKKGPYRPLTDRIVEAVKELGSARGVSFALIKKYLDSEYPASPDANPATIRKMQRQGLARAVESGAIRGHLLHPTTRFVRSKLPAAKAPKTKKAARRAPTKKSSAEGRTKKSSSKVTALKRAPSFVASDVDPASGLSGSVHGAYSCSLKQINLSENMDKFYIMQVIEEASGSFTFYTRWGRTGVVGQQQTFEFDEAEEAEEAMEKKFKEKTGNNWGDDFVAHDGKYKLIVANDEPLDGNVVWQYWVDDGVDGKATGWYNYADEASETVEGVYQENTRNSDMEVRCVQSGAFNYRVDFTTMTQTNLTHSGHKQRKIRRSTR